MPIFVRPVREQLEHDRLIRFLQVRYKRKFEAAINVGDDRLAPVKIGEGEFYPDLVLTSGKKLAGLVEVETGESVNNLEALAQWTHFSRARVPFHLYVPVTGLDAARRFCAAHGARPAEIWTYRGTNEGFDLVRMFHDASVASARSVADEEPARREGVKPAAKASTKAAAKPAKPVKPAKAAKASKAAKATKAPKAKTAAKPGRSAAKGKPAARSARKR